MNILNQKTVTLGPARNSHTRWVYRLVILLGILVLSAGSLAAVPPQVRMKRSARVQPGPLRLNQIADIISSSASMKKRLSDIIVTEFSSDTKNHSVDTNIVKQALRRENIIPASVDLYGAGSCRITLTNTLPAQTAKVTKPAPPLPKTEKQTTLPKGPPPKTLSDSLKEYVARSLEMKPSQLVVKWHCSAPNILKQPADNNRFTIKPRSHASLGRVVFQIVDKNASTANQTPSSKQKTRHLKQKPLPVTVHGTVEYIYQAVVAARSLRSGHVLTPADVKTMPHRIDNMSKMGITDPDSVIGLQITRPVSVHQAFKTGMIKKLILVQRRNPVEVQAGNRCVRIRLRGIAQTEGGMGDIITVRNENNKNLFFARVTGPGTVTVETKEIRTEKLSPRLASVKTQRPVRE